MKKHNNYYSGVGKDTWKELEKVIAIGYSRHNVFSDWLDLMLNAHLSFTNNLQRYGIKAVEKLKTNSFDGLYEDRYMEIASRYDSNKPQGQRPMDYFTRATGLLMKEVAETQQDVLGKLYMGCITFGEHGQYFTPEHITDMMVEMVGVQNGETISDPACGTGRFLLSARKKNPNAVLYGNDLDMRCAKMCALNMVMFNCNAVVLCGDSLAIKYYYQWAINKGGLIFEIEIKESEIPAVAKKFEQGTLPLAA